MFQLRRLTVGTVKNVCVLTNIRSLSLIPLKFHEHGSGKIIEVQAEVGKSLLDISLGTCYTYIYSVHRFM